MRTILRVLIGLIAACLTAALVKVLHVITPSELAGLSGPALTARLFRLGELGALTATQQAIFVVPLAAIAVVVAEVNRIRSWFAYAIIGAIIAGAGFCIQFVSETAIRTIVNPYAGQAYAIEGIAAGLIYWLLAGRFAGWRRGGGLVKTQPYPVGKPRLNVSDVPVTERKTAESA
ncbi:MAG: hypothetical protein ABL901_11570 [Hyphomicrobiaceae bacterium]